MFMKLLYELSREDSYSDIKAARKFKISEKMIVEMKSQLEKMGYIKEHKDDCTGSCGCGCSGCKSCSSSKPIMKMWMITEKGKSAIENFKNNL